MRSISGHRSSRRVQGGARDCESRSDASGLAVTRHGPVRVRVNDDDGNGGRHRSNVRSLDLRVGHWLVRHIADSRAGSPCYTPLMTRQLRAIVCVIIGLLFLVAAARDTFFPELFTVSVGRPIYNVAWAVFFIALGLRSRRLASRSA